MCRRQGQLFCPKLHLGLPSDSPLARRGRVSPQQPGLSQAGGGARTSEQSRAVGTAPSPDGAKRGAGRRESSRVRPLPSRAEERVCAPGPADCRPRAPAGGRGPRGPGSGCWGRPLPTHGRHSCAAAVFIPWLRHEPPPSRAWTRRPVRTEQGAGRGRGGGQEGSAGPCRSPLCLKLRRGFRAFAFCGTELWVRCGRQCHLAGPCHPQAKDSSRRVTAEGSLEDVEGGRDSEAALSRPGRHVRGMTSSPPPRV